MTSKKRSLFSKTALLSALAGTFLFNAPAQAETIYMVQLGSFENENKARERWEQLSGKFPELFSPLTFKRKEVKLPSDDFVYHRAQAGPIQNRADAEAICDDLLISGFECYIAETALFEPAVKTVQTAVAAAPAPVIKAVAAPVQKLAAAAPAEIVAPKAVVASPAFPPLPDAFDALDGPAPVATELKVQTPAQKAIATAKETLRPTVPAPSLAAIATPKADVSDIGNALEKEVAAFNGVQSAPEVALKSSIPEVSAPKVTIPQASVPEVSMIDPSPVLDLPAPGRSSTPLISEIEEFKPVPLPTAQVAKAIPAVPAFPVVSPAAAVSGLPEFIQNKQNATAAPVAAVNPLPAFIREKNASTAQSAVAGLPFQQGQSTDHLRAQNFASAPSGAVQLDVPPAELYTAVTPSNPVVVDNITEAPSVSGAQSSSVQFAEAVRVPLVDVPQQRQKQSRLPSISHFKGYPSASLKTSSLWAEMSYFTNQKAALGYWGVLQKRDAQLPKGVRLRVTRPFVSNSSKQRVSLRVGPFKNVSVVKRLCSHTREEKLLCRAVKDLGSSIANRSSGPRQRYNAGQRRALSSNRAATSGFWLQLGSYSSIRDAQNSWVDMKETYPKQLSVLQQDIMTPRRSSTRGNNYRLRAGPFSDSSSAVSACERLKRHGGLCIVVADR